MNKRSFGYMGENLAAEYLISKGYEIIKNNFTVRGGEIDIIAKKDGVLVFVEVKTRTGESFGKGSESVNTLKKRRLLRAIERYLNKLNLKYDPDYRLDVVEIELNAYGGVKTISHFEDIEI